LFDYGYDRESAMWSRDALDQVLTGLMASPITGRIHVVAHSIGTMLTMEALRQVYGRQPAAGEHIGAVVFASPDIDLDVFTSSVAHIGPLAGKITVVTATNDRALAVSGFLAGGITRVGAAEKAELVRLGLHVIDASAQGWGIINHDLFLSNAKVRRVVRRAIDGRPIDGA
jgi:esterase/lipase superfamily enzyme